MAGVGLQTTFLQVSEDVGVEQVCVIVTSPTIDCPIAFPFVVNVETGDNSAGNLYVCCSAIRRLD